jgi:S1-C subfamily serine protease
MLVLAALLVLAACASPSTRSAATSTSRVTPLPTVSVPASATDLEDTIQAVIKRAEPSIVEVQSTGSQGQGLGSGNIITADGYIVTNDHVVRGFQTYAVVLATGRTLPATLVGEAPADDLAVLKITAAGLLPITWGNSDALEVGSFVLAIGSPLGLDGSATLGIVSALNRTASEAPSGPATTLTSLIQTSAPINPGNSGGALMNLNAQLVGIPTLSAATPSGAANGIGFAIPSNRVQFIADQLVKDGRVTSTGQGFLGVTGADVTAQLAAAYALPADHGVLITGFVPDASGKSPAQVAGLQREDIIIAVNQTTITGNGDLAGVLLPLSPGTKIQVTVQRGSSQPRFTVQLGERPAS